MEVNLLPTCQHCFSEWTYKQSLKNLLLLKCPYCGEKNYARKFRIRDIIVGVGFPIINLFIFPLMNVSYKWMFLLTVIGLLIYMMTYPINLQLTKDEEPLF